MNKQNCWIQKNDNYYIEKKIYILTNDSFKWNVKDRAFWALRRGSCIQSS